jgi:hypothetical protein
MRAGDGVCDGSGGGGGAALTTMSDFEDGKLYTAQHTRALSTEECEAWFGLDPGEWAQVKRDIIKGSKRFWQRRGLPEPNGGWQAWNDMISEKAAAKRGRKKGEVSDENDDCAGVDRCVAGDEAAGGEDGGEGVRGDEAEGGGCAV